jgi:curved DNA-binding protein
LISSSLVTNSLLIDHCSSQRRLKVEYKDYYKILGVERNATQDEIKKSYRKLARKCHPDTCKDDPKAEQRFKSINEANEVLGDPEKRARYDALGSNWQQGQDFAPPPGFEQFFNFGGQGGRGKSYRFDFGESPRSTGNGFSDFFETLFGGLGGMDRAPEQHSFRRQAQTGSDIESEIAISLEDVFKGGTKEIGLQDAEGIKRLSIKIPKGAHDGMKIRLAGQGNQGPGGPGDLYLKLHIQPDSRFKIEGENLIMDVPVMPWDAALGETLEIETLEGKVNLKIPAGISSGQRLRFKGRGLSHRGDLYAQIKIVMPSQLSSEQKKLFSDLKKISEKNKGE